MNNSPLFLMEEPMSASPWSAESSESAVLVFFLDCIRAWNSALFIWKSGRIAVSGAKNDKYWKVLKRNKTTYCGAKTKGRTVSQCLGQRGFSLDTESGRADGDGGGKASAEAGRGLRVGVRGLFEPTRDVVCINQQLLIIINIENYSN